MLKYAITRKPSPLFYKGETHGKLGAPDFSQTLVQHNKYCEALEYCGLKVITLPEEMDYPDAPFVEDTSVVTDEISIVTRPGVLSRRGEEKSIAREIKPYRETVNISSPGTLDGGDVLRAENHFFIGQSQRTDQNGAEQLGQILENYGYTWEVVPVKEGLHLKSSASYLGNNTLILSPSLQNESAWEGYEKIVVPEEESYAANCIVIGNKILMSKGFPETKKKLTALGKTLIELEMSEFEKMDGSLTCLSLLFC